MAYAIIPAPGSGPGPCANPCEHKDCVEHRKNAEASCVFCQEPIGYKTPMAFHALDDAPAHWNCILENEEKLSRSNPGK